MFDNDGTLWAEKPAYVQLDFLVRRLAELAKADPTLTEKEPYAAASAGDLGWFGEAVVKHYDGDDAQLESLAGAVFSAFQGSPSNGTQSWCGSSSPQPSTPCCVALHRLRLRAHGGVDALPGGRGLHQLHRLRRRPGLHAAGDTCHVRSAARTGDRKLSRAGLRRRPPPDDRAPGVSQRRPGEGGANLGAGRTSADLAAGNSNGDIEMLEFAEASSGPSMSMLIRHDDSSREFAYTAGAERALDTAAERGWTVVSISDDWRSVFS